MPRLEPGNTLLRFEPPLLGGRLVRRYKRFLADIELDDGRTVTAHCPDPGAMHDLAIPGSRVALSARDDPRRKLPWTWEMVERAGVWVGVNTGRTNQLVETALLAQALPELAGLGPPRREVRAGASRLDFGFGPRADGGFDAYLEVKTVTLAAGAQARFPDAPTARGRKHLHTLLELAAGDRRAVLLFFVNRGDCEEFGPADDIDPEYAALLRGAARGGVEVYAWRAAVTPKQVRLDRPIPALV